MKLLAVLGYSRRLIEPLDLATFEISNTEGCSVKVLECTTQQADPRQFVLVIDTLTKPQDFSSGILFRVNHGLGDGVLSQIYPGSSTISGQSISKSEAFLNAYDPKPVVWKDGNDCFRVVGSQYRFKISLTVPGGVQTYVGDLEETIGGQINPNGLNCPHPLPPPPEHYRIVCKSH